MLAVEWSQFVDIQLISTNKLTSYQYDHCIPPCNTFKRVLNKYFRYHEKTINSLQHLLTLIYINVQKLIKNSIACLWINNIPSYGKIGLKK